MLFKSTLLTEYVEHFRRVVEVRDFSLGNVVS